MSWVRLDDQFPNHAKIMSVGSDAFRLHVTAMCWAANQLTDGAVPVVATRQLGWFCADLGRSITELETAGLWDAMPDGWRIHDYLDYNPSREQVVKERTEAKERMRNKRGSSAEVRPNISRTSDNVQAPPSPSPSSSSGSPTIADVHRLFTERFFETFGHQPPMQAGDDGDFAALVASGITLQQIDHAIASSLEGFKPTNSNPYPKTWRYCLPAMQRAMEPPKPKNGTDPAKPAVTHTHPDTEEKSRRFQEACDVLLAEGLHPDTDVLFYRKIDERIEAKYGKQPTR